MAGPPPYGSSFPFFAALLILAAVHGAKFASGYDGLLSQIPSDLYHSSKALLEKIRNLVDRHPDVLTLETMIAGNNGYAAEVVVVTYDNAQSQKNDTLKFRILMSFGQHGRELITSEVALHLLRVLSEQSRILGLDSTSLRKLPENLVIKVVPIENINGRKIVEAGDFCERRNGRGVDLNRNWSVDWGKKEKDYDPYEENPGAAPFSEPEAQIMRNLSKTFDPHIWINVHSGMEALFMPYDHKNATPDGLTPTIMRLLLEDLNHRHFRDKCLVGSGGGLVGYFAHGTTTDYMYDIAKVPMAFTFEIFGDLTASSKNCFKMFNPVEKIVFDEVVSKWTAAFIALFEIGPRWLDKALTASPEVVKLVPQGGKVRDGSLAGIIRESKMEVLELGIKELRTYFRLFLLSSVLLLFMFCSRILKSKNRQTY